MAMNEQTFAKTEAIPSQTLLTQPLPSLFKQTIFIYLMKIIVEHSAPVSLLATISVKPEPAKSTGTSN